MKLTTREQRLLDSIRFHSERLWRWWSETHPEPTETDPLYPHPHERQR